MSPDDLLRPVRIAVYRDPTAEPEVEELAPDGSGFLRRVAARVEHHVAAAGGGIPAVAIREVVDNLIHARCVGATISILDDGRKVVVADLGGGVQDPQRALLPGYSAASEEAREHIRGVGAGLPIAAAAAAAEGVVLRIDSNIAGGAAVTLDATGPASPPDEGEPSELTEREKRALLLLHELGPMGPTQLARELRVALSTGHRTLTGLERRGLVASEARGKRSLTEDGIAQLSLIFVE